MSETVREMTYDEQIANFIMHILAIETPFGVKRDLIGDLLSLTYRHERDITDALYTPMPSCTFLIWITCMGFGLKEGLIIWAVGFGVSAIILIAMFFITEDE